ncbi:MAG: hypothetical protein J1F31_01210 [Erysipelotrichales bacterium]|nr:hypothetical protein [Erysipelotrichales bacterium]
MKSVTKKLFALGGVFLMGMSLASCGISQSAADKINKAREDGKHLTYDQLIKDYGKPTYDLTAEVFGSRSGDVTWVKGCDSSTKVKEKLDNGEKLSALTVVILNNKAMSATWIEDFTGIEK